MIRCKFPAIHILRQTYKTFLRTAVNLSYKIIGESTAENEEPPVFLIHGLLGRKKHWRGLGKTILNMTRRTVITLDQRNHGSSPHVSSHMYEELASDILRLMNKLEVEKASLIGHSMGGRTAMCVSLMAPDRVAGILVVDVSPVSSPMAQTKEFHEILKAMKAVDFENPKKIGRAKKRASRHLKTLISDDILMKVVLSNIKLKKDGTIGWICNLNILLKYFDYIAAFPSSMNGKQYAGPALFIGGQISDFLPPDDLPSIRELFPQSVITYIKGTGHNLHAEDPRSFLELAIKFLDTNHL